MKYRQLGHTGLTVSELCMGTMTFGSNFYNIGEVDQSGANALVERALEAGINFFDTADVYSFGESEKVLGEALRTLATPRDEIVIATKVRNPMSPAAGTGEGDVNNRGLSRKHIKASVEASLKRLDTDHVDLYQVHGWDDNTPMEETLRALDDLVRDGKVLYIGCSNWTARHLARALALSEANGWARFISLQAYYSLAGRDLEHELQPLAAEQGLGVMPWSPMAGGFLSGKFRRDQAAPAGARRADFDFPPIDREQAYDAVDLMEQIANENNATIPQIALAWLLGRPAVSSVIVGAKKLSQLEDNLQAVDVELSDDQMDRLNAVTQPPAQYPGWMVERQNRKR
ncbi:MAG: aldo/keto reductase [Salinisphaera sp.]|jgi:aryl-alcohol dehydrogenase-like predicted oxidoreductase|nr:aldo/keto reductase [Salinisphaera sp.]